jgi:hypothetical protein
LHELQAKGFGRLADIQSHDAAVAGLPESINILYHRKFVDKIFIHTFLAHEKVMNFVLKDNKWNYDLPPGNVITAARNEQLKNKEMVSEAEQLSMYVSSQMKIISSDTPSCKASEKLIQAREKIKKIDISDSVTLFRKKKP